jgi:hypothetical protein
MWLKVMTGACDGLMVFNYDELTGTSGKSLVNFVFRCDILCWC